MFKILLISVILLLGIAAALPVKERPVAKSLKLKWKCEIGQTSDRTRPVISGGYIWIGSNGSHYNDYAVDYGNGIYQIVASSGKVTRHFLDDQIGDMDVNGIVKIGDLFYAGSDNEELTCFDGAGNVKWRIPSGGDIEHRPVALTIDGKEVLVYATENGEIAAINPENGDRIWSHFHSEFKGWRPGDNRFVFKVNNYFWMDNCYFSEPAFADLNKDGTSDLIFNSKYSSIEAINGRTGKKMFVYKYIVDENPTLLGRNKPFISKVNNHFVCWIPVKTEKGFELRGLNSKGEVKYQKSLPKCEMLLTSQNPSVGEGTFDNAYVDLNSFKFTHYKWNKVVKTEYYNYLECSNGRYADDKVKFNGEVCNVIVYENGPESNSVLAIVGQNTGAVHFKQLLPAVSEFTPVVQDVDSDGKLDLLVNCRDGNLYCYSLGVNSKELVKH